MKSAKNLIHANAILTVVSPLRVKSVAPIQPGSWPRMEMLERAGSVLMRRWSSCLFYVIKSPLSFMIRLNTRYELLQRKE